MTLKGGDRALGSMDDAFYLAELVYKKGGQIVGKAIGLTPKQIRKKNLFLKVTKELESKGHYTHSPLQRTTRFMHEFKKPILDTKLKKLKRILKKYPK